MAKPGSFFLYTLVLLLYVITAYSRTHNEADCSQSWQTIGCEWYNHYAIVPAHKIVLSKRDTSSENSIVTTVAAAAATANPSAIEKKSTLDFKKGEANQFPDTKEPYIRTDGVSVKPSKYDKYGKEDKKPLGKPEEKPVLKPESNPQENSTASDSSSNASTTSTIASASADASLNSRKNSSSSDDGDIAKEDDSPLNMEGYSSNISVTDHHRYYISYAFSGQDVRDHLWVDLQNASESELLSSAHRQAYTLSLPFDFPFYGHILRSITIATGGFLYTGDLLHTWLAATQYIAPLMANFDTSAHADSKVKHLKNDTSLTVQWENVKLKDKLDGGSFTFQVTIHNSGDIVFSYKDVPIPVNLIADDDHPVKVGLSDAYIMQKTIFYVRRKTIYEYHKIDMKKPEKISNWTAIFFRALPTCVSYHDCHSCVTQNSTFQCLWCGKVQRCSDGMDRHRQDWLQSRCDFLNAEHAELCKLEPVVSAPPNTQAITKASASASAASVDTNLLQPTADMLEDRSASDSKAVLASSGVATGVTVAILVCLLACVVGWIAYAYYFPLTSSGQLLIKYRPSTWSFKRGEARYTAASMHSIHM